MCAFLTTREVQDIDIIALNVLGMAFIVKTQSIAGFSGEKITSLSAHEILTSKLSTK